MVSYARARKRARELLRENRKMERSWRTIAREDFDNKIPPGTICRFAKSKGTWVPGNTEHLILLGLKKAPAPRPMPELFDMSTAALTAALKNRMVMPPPDPRIIKQFVKLGWLKKSRRVNA
jgi:hypothetical protein